MKGTKTLLLLTTLIAPTISLADVGREIIYLRCKADPEYLGAPNIIIDKVRKIITIVPLKDGLPLTEDETTYEGRLEFQGVLMNQISVNKFTLRYSVRSVLNPKFVTGQCVIEERKI